MLKNIFNMLKKLHKGNTDVSEQAVEEVAEELSNFGIGMVIVLLIITLGLIAVVSLGYGLLIYGFICLLGTVTNVSITFLPCFISGLLLTVGKMAVMAVSSKSNE